MAAQNSLSGGEGRRHSARAPVPRRIFDSGEAAAPARPDRIAAPKRRPPSRPRGSSESSRRLLPVPENAVLKYVVQLRKMNQIDPLRHLAALQIMRERDSGLEDKILRLTKLLLPRHREFLRDLDDILPKVPRAPYPLLPKLGGWKGRGSLRKLVRAMGDTDKNLVQMWLWRFGKGGGVSGFVGRVRTRMSDKKWWKWVNQVAWCAKNRASVGEVWKRVGRRIGKKSRRELAALLRFEKSLGKQAGKAWKLVRFDDSETDFWQSYREEHPVLDVAGIPLDREKEHSRSPKKVTSESQKHAIEGVMPLENDHQSLITTGDVGNTADLRAVEAEKPEEHETGQVFDGPPSVD